MRLIGASKQPCDDYGGIFSGKRICCAASCGICAPLSKDCHKRPGGSKNCCISQINSRTRTCGRHVKKAPCYIKDICISNSRYIMFGFQTCNELKKLLTLCCMNDVQR